MIDYSRSLNPPIAIITSCTAKRFMSITQVRKICTQEYHRMAEAGIFSPEERIELIEGQIWQMAAKGAGHSSKHSAGVTRCEKTLRRLLGDRVLIRLQDPIQLDDYSEPEPDIAIVQPRGDDYAAKHPTVAEVFLLVEVSDTTLKHDLETKASIYAKAGILEYWVLNVINCQLHVFRDPSINRYQVESILGNGDIATSIAFPDIVVPVGSIAIPLTIP